MKTNVLFSLFHIGVSIQSLNKKTEKKLGLSLVQWCLLRQLLSRPGVSAHVLAISVGVHPSTLTQTLKRLEKKGFVYLAEDPKDSRKKIISLTRLGKSTLDLVERQMETWSGKLSILESELDRIRVMLKNQLIDVKSRG